MKFLVIGDLHGKNPRIKYRDFDAFVIVGDVCEDRDIAPIYSNFFRLLREMQKGEVISFEEFVLGFLEEKASVSDFEKKSLKKGNEILRYLDSFNKPMFMVAGNWDQSYGPTRIKDIEKNDYNYLKTFLDWWMGEKLNPELIKGVRNVRNCMFSNLEWKGFNIIGYGNSSGPEKVSGKKRSLDLSKEEIEKLNMTYYRLRNKLRDSYRKRKNKKLPTIFITHNVPHNTKLDIVKNEESYAHNKHLGSTVAREFCDKYRPLLCVGGHIHEGRGKDKIKKTLVINAGYGSQAQVLIEIDEKTGKIRKVEF